jgi:hypothetical protein
MKNDNYNKKISEITKRILDLGYQSERKWGKLNVCEMLQHCILHLRMNYQNTKGIIRFDKIAKLYILYFRIDYIKNLPTVYQINIKKKNISVPVCIESLKKELIQEIKIRLIENSDLNKVVYHPFFGKLSNKEYIHINLIHIDHHLVQFGK